MPTLTLKAPPLHPAQREIVQCDVRYRVVACGRRWGKTRLGVLAAFWVAAPGGVAWWVAPTYKMASVGWRQLRRLTRAIPGAETREGDRIASFPTGGWVEVRSADDPDSLRGEGLDLAVLDEAAFLREETWTQAIRPALSDRHGRALFLSTPNGNNWFQRVHARGQDPLQPEYASWNRPSWENPFLDRAEIEQARHDMPEDTFRQEYGAEFMDTAGSYFRGVRLAVEDSHGTRQDDHQGASVAVGVDWGDRNDYSVFTAATARRLVGFERLNQTGYDYQLAMLKAFCDRQQPQLVLVELNSMGTMTLERLQAELSFPVQGFTTTNQSKRELLDALKLAIETRAFTYPDIPVLLSELQAFRAHVTVAGNVTLSAPPGFHDDCVVSLALGYWAATRLAGSVGSWSDLKHRAPPSLFRR